MTSAVVIGLARTGVAMARALADEGYAVRVVDSADDDTVRNRAAELPRGVGVELGGYPVDVASGAALVSPSPGVRWDAPELEWARAHGIPVRSEMDLVFERFHGPIVGVTGTNGKTTTTALVAAILERDERRVLLGGNIGTPVIDKLHATHDDEWLVLELSSFQLETVEQPRCSIACVLNVTPDHLDRHGAFEVYAGIKERIVRHARDDVVLGYDDPVTRLMAHSASARLRFFGAALTDQEGVTLRDADIVSIEAGRAMPVLPVSSIPLFGTHNVFNVMAAVAMARAASVEPATIAAAVRDFRAVPHRLEIVLERDGVVWINDSKATNPDSAIVGLRAFSGRPLVWIGGGRSGGAPAGALADEVAAHARAVVLNGESARDLDAALEQRGFSERVVVPTLDHAVQRAHDLARAGDIVLFSPGFKSFDQFHDFEARGDRFRELVQAIAADTVSAG
ncbi:MAG: UDP-N-acetylmuramoyl-L-alanine--D-glutamate ligase [Candidatus Dormibacteraeota bacterium]|nr:UDP-N-acetylmuramoyl-L-alanine--D-glutamate ligase [Candidatus Dormibacteraeota bacterium]